MLNYKAWYGDWYGVWKMVPKKKESAPPNKTVSPTYCWRIIPVSKYLATMVIVSPVRIGLSSSKWPFYGLFMGMILTTYPSPGMILIPHLSLKKAPISLPHRRWCASEPRFFQASNEKWRPKVKFDFREPNQLEVGFSTQLGVGRLSGWTQPKLRRQSR